MNIVLSNDQLVEILDVLRPTRDEEDDKKKVRTCLHWTQKPQR